MTEPKPKFDSAVFKKGISYVESRGKYTAANETSSAAGKYQFLFTGLKKNNPELLKGITKDDFLNNPELQEKIMELAIEGKLKSKPGYIKNAIDLTNDYKEKLGKKWNFREDEVAALTHFLGRSGARDYFKSLIEGKEYKVPGQNKTPEGYLKDYNKGAGMERGIQEIKMDSQMGSEKPFEIKLDERPVFVPRDNTDVKMPGIKPPMPSPTQMQMNPMPDPELKQPTPAEFVMNYIQQNKNKFAMGGNTDPKKKKIAKDTITQISGPMKFLFAGEPTTSFTRDFPAGSINDLINKQPIEYKKQFLDNSYSTRESIFPGSSEYNSLREKNYLNKLQPNKSLDERYMNQKVSDNSYAMGGSLQEFNAGGSHEMNPLGGIPITQNDFVEENETMKDNYVFSDRIILDEDTVKAAGLSKKDIGNSIADTTKKYERFSKESSNPIDRQTADEMIERTKAASEIKRSQLAQAQQSNMMGWGGPSSNAGSGYNTATSGGGFGGNWMGAAAGIAGGLAGAFGNKGENPSNMDTGVEAGYEAVKTGVAAAIPIAGLFKAGSDALNAGAQAIGGDEAGAWMKGFTDPFSVALREDSNWGEKTLSILDPVAGAIINSTLEKEQKNKQYKKEDIADISKNQFLAKGNSYWSAFGGPIHKMPFGGPYLSYTTPEFTPRNYGALEQFRNPFQPVEIDSTINVDLPGAYKASQDSPRPSLGYTLNEIEIPDTSKIVEKLNKTGKKDNGFISDAGKWIKDNGASLLRYSPVGMNVAQLMSMKKPEEESTDRYLQKYQRNHIDERSFLNQANNEYNNVANALKSTNMGPGSLRSNLLMLHKQKQEGLSGNMFKAEQMKQQENQLAQQFDFQVGRTNMQQSNIQKDWNARNRAAYENNKSRLLGQIGTDLGNIGLEELRKKYPERMGLYYNWMGNYYDPNKSTT